MLYQNLGAEFVIMLLMKQDIFELQATIFEVWFCKIVYNVVVFTLELLRLQSPVVQLIVLLGWFMCYYVARLSNI